ncbi:MAG TPA: GTPase domain-containing protein, partial [Acidimicrobiales bacterium]|nr:GTPase domain-containing protein [Acidimicrobiales bacterium]
MVQHRGSWLTDSTPGDNGGRTARRRCRRRLPASTSRPSAGLAPAARPVAARPSAGLAPAPRPVAARPSAGPAPAARPVAARPSAGLAPAARRRQLRGRPACCGRRPGCAPQASGLPRAGLVRGRCCYRDTGAHRSRIDRWSARRAPQLAPRRATTGGRTTGPTGGRTTGQYPLGVERIGLVGLPNSGKSSLFNALTGGSALVAGHP